MHILMFTTVALQYFLHKHTHTKQNTILSFLIYIYIAYKLLEQRKINRMNEQDRGATRLNREK